MADLTIFLRAYVAGLVGFLIFTGAPFSASTAVSTDPPAFEQPATDAKPGSTAGGRDAT